MPLPRVRFTVRRMMVAVAVVAMIAALGVYIDRASRKDPVPTNAVEALAYAARCAERRERDFRLEEYDAQVTRLKPGDLTGIFIVTFVKKDDRGAPTHEISYAIQDYGYCMKVRRRGPPKSSPPEPPEPE